VKNYLLILGIISILLISACSQQTEPVQPAPQPKAVIEDEVEETAVVPDSDVKEFDMTARQWSFEPSTITVKKDDKVRLNIKNEDVTHGFALFEFDVNERLAPGKTTTIEFTADKTGEYVFFCSVPCGKGHKDMKGKLIVE